jgi:NAD(P)-dependent dehydrogenase (short-subunit alcohol dehydrogenase family)
MQGWQVFAGVRSDAAAAELAAAGAGIQPVLLDVTKPESVSSALQQVQQQLGADGLSGLINNAGQCYRAQLRHKTINLTCRAPSHIVSASSACCLLQPCSAADMQPHPPACALHSCATAPALVHITPPPHPPPHLQAKV